MVEVVPAGASLLTRSGADDTILGQLSRKVFETPAFGRPGSLINTYTEYDDRETWLGLQLGAGAAGWCQPTVREGSLLRQGMTGFMSFGARES